MPVPEKEYFSVVFPETKNKEENPGGCEEEIHSLPQRSNLNLEVTRIGRRAAGWLQDHQPHHINRSIGTPQTIQSNVVVRVAYLFRRFPHFVGFCIPAVSINTFEHTSRCVSYPRLHKSFAVSTLQPYPHIIGKMGTWPNPPTAHPIELVSLSLAAGGLAGLMVFWLLRKVRHSCVSRLWKKTYLTCSRKDTHK